MNNSKIKHTYFHSLEIEGIGCFKDKQTLDLSNGNNGYASWTLILGDNGTGKTTLLKILDHIKPKNYFHKFSDEIDKIPSILFNSVFKSEAFKVKYKTNSSNKFAESKWPRSNQTVLYQDNFTDVYLISYGATRRMSRTNNITNIYETELTTLFDDSLELINAEEWYFQKFLNEKTSEENVALIFANQLEIIKKILINFLPDISDLRPKTISYIKESSSLELKLNDNKWISLREMSHGYQTMTALLVDISTRMMVKYPESDNPLAEPVIILIDEIDLHLHPKWQRQIMEQFSKYFPQAQFIVTSHSPLIVQAAEAVNANIVVCRKDGDKVIIDNDPEEVKGWRIDQILISDLFDLPSIRSKADEEKMSRYYELMAKSELTNQEKSELEEIQKVIKKSFESDKPFSETERKINQFLETHLK